MVVGGYSPIAQIGEFDSPLDDTQAIRGMRMTIKGIRMACWLLSDLLEQEWIIIYEIRRIECSSTTILLQPLISWTPLNERCRIFSCWK